MSDLQLDLSQLPRKRPVGKPRLLAVCHDCQKKHVITEFDILRTDSIRDWEMKHRRHRIEFLDPVAYERSIAAHAVHEYRHNADVKLSYAIDVDYTITIASLATSSTRTTGRESTAVVNTSNLYLDYMIAGKITTGTSPTANKTIEVIAIGSEDDTPTYPDGHTGVNAAYSFTSDNIKNSIARYVAAMNVGSTSDRTYPFGPVSLAQLFGIVPTHHIIDVMHDTAVNLNATGSNHVITYVPVYATVT